MKRYLSIMVVVFAVFSSNIAFGGAPARPQDIPADQFADAREWLARAVIVEEGVNDEKGWSAVSWVYLRRWTMYKARGRNLSLTTVVRGHSAALRLTRTSFTARQTLLRGLPSTATTDAQRAMWAHALRFVDAWYAGQVKDTCEGDPYDYGGAHDGVPPWFERAVCDGVDNYFWIARPKPANWGQDATSPTTVATSTP